MTSNSSLRSKRPVGSWEPREQLSCQRHFKSSSDGKASGVQEVAGTSRAVWWRKKEDEHHALVVPTMGMGCASFTQPDNLCPWWSREAFSALQWPTLLELIHIAGPGHSSVLSSEQLFSTLHSLVVFLVCFRGLPLQFKNPSSELYLRHCLQPCAV